MTVAITKEFIRDLTRLLDAYKIEGTGGDCGFVLAKKIVSQLDAAAAKKENDKVTR